MNSVVKRQTLPQFSAKIPAPLFWFAVAVLPLLYVVCLVLWPLPPFVPQLLFFLLPGALLLWRFPLRHGFVTQNYALRFLGVLLLAAALTLLNNNVIDPFCQSIFPMPPGAQALLDALFHPHWRFGLVYDIFQIALVPAIAEELLFRGLILTALLRKMPVWAAVLLNGFLFALYHLNPWQFLGLFLLGSAFAAIFVKTRNLTLVMLAHFVNNLIGVLTWWFFEKH